MSDADLATVDLVAEVDVGDRTWGSAVCGRTRSYVERPMQVRRIVRGRAPAKALWLRVPADGPLFGRCEVAGAACDFEPEGRMILLLEHVRGRIYAPRSICDHSAYWMRGSGTAPAR